MGCTLIGRGGAAGLAGCRNSSIPGHASIENKSLARSIAYSRPTLGSARPHEILESGRAHGREAILAELSEHFAPANAVEALLVEQLAVASWRLRRCRIIETRIFHQRVEDLTEDEVESFSERSDALGHAYQDDCSGTKSLASLSHLETKAERAFYRALRELQRLRPAKGSPSKPAVVPKNGPVFPILGGRPRSPVPIDAPAARRPTHQPGLAAYSRPFAFIRGSKRSRACPPRASTAPKPAAPAAWWPAQTRSPPRSAAALSTPGP